MANLDERKKEIASLISKAQEAVEKGDLETARNLKADIDAQKKEFEELEQLSEEIEASAPKQEETPPKDEGAEETDNKTEQSKDKPAEAKEDTTVDNAKGEEKPKAEDDKPSSDDKAKEETPTIEKVEEPTEDELEEEKDKKKKEGEKRSMAKLNQNTETNEEVLAFEQYMKSKGAKRDNVKSDDVGVTIPEDIKYIPEKEVKTVQDLSELVQ